MKIDYDLFHKNTKIQKKIISGRNFTYRVHLSVLAKYLGNNLSVLDVGCGSGAITFYVASKGNKVVGIDVSRKAINICRETSKSLGLSHLTRFEVADFSTFDSPVKFDLIICTEVLEHLSDDREVLQKFLKILNNGGTLFISVPSKNSPIFKHGLSKDFDKKVGHLRRYSLSELEKILTQVGYEIVEKHKVEGIFRNFLFLNPIAGKFIKFIKGPVSDFLTFFDNLLVPLFGEADLIVVARKK